MKPNSHVQQSQSFLSRNTGDFGSNRTSKEDTFTPGGTIESTDQDLVRGARYYDPESWGSPHHSRSNGPFSTSEPRHCSFEYGSTSFNNDQSMTFTSSD